MYGEGDRYADYEHPIVFHNGNKVHNNQCWMPDVGAIYNPNMDINSCNYYSYGNYNSGNMDELNIDQGVLHDDMQRRTPECFQSDMPNGHGTTDESDVYRGSYIDNNMPSRFYGDCNNMEVTQPPNGMYTDHPYHESWNNTEDPKNNFPPSTPLEEDSLKNENIIHGRGAPDEGIIHQQSLDYCYMNEMNSASISSSPGTLRFLITETGYLHLVSGDKPDAAVPFFRYTKLPFDFSKINTQHARHLAESLATDASLVKEWILARSSYQSRKKISVYLRCGMHKQCKFRVTVTICPPTFSSQQGTIVLVRNGGHSNNIKSRTRKFS